MFKDKNLKTASITNQKSVELKHRHYETEQSLDVCCAAFELPWTREAGDQNNVVF